MNLRLALCLLGLWVAVSTASPNTLVAQDPAEEHQRLMEALSGEPRSAVDPETGENVWKFGVRITSAGGAAGITATCPIPIEWPEQAVVEVEQNGTDNVNRISFKRLAPEVHQMVVKVNRLEPGAVAEATVTYRIQKTAPAEPVDLHTLRIPTKTPSKIRKYLSPSPYIESTNRVIREAAAQIQFAEDATDWEKVEQIYDWVRENIQYKFDTQIHTCMEALESGFGDCEELSSMFIAICRIKKIPARAVWVPGHTYPEFYLEDADGNGAWYACEAAGPRSFGAHSDSRPILQKGDKFKVAGNPEPTRYVQPTLVAKQVNGQPTLEWISEQVFDRPDTDNGTDSEPEAEAEQQSDSSQR